MQQFSPLGSMPVLAEKTHQSASDKAAHGAFRRQDAA
jgi:hypothetical protein